ncbi:MAG: hypothetical protein GY855_05105 [candidate division Zixibacteria bacterium]|nr:hypothetical protein [candidate division Zixibacteria bacterium]
MKSKAAILNSRQSKRPIGSDKWIVNSINAAKYCIDKGLTIFSSIGISTYEVITYAAVKYGGNLIIVLPPAIEYDTLIKNISTDFKLDKNNVGFFFPDDLRNEKKSDQLERDKYIISNSDLIIPVSINSEGNLQSLIKKSSRKHELVCDFKTDYPGYKRILKVDYSKLRIQDWSKREDWNYLTHWTRTCNTPWSNETKYDYYESILKSEAGYHHSALNTLCRVLDEKLLRASSKHLHKGVNAVAFSELRPADVVPLMKWRPRLVSMSFEPYGIAIEKDFAQHIGIKRVLYGNPEMYDILKSDEKPFFHSMGEKGDWMPEKEHRYLGDLKLDDIPADKRKIIVKFESEIQKVQSLTSSEVLPLFK